MAEYGGRNRSYPERASQGGSYGNEDRRHDERFRSRAGNTPRDQADRLHNDDDHDVNGRNIWTRSVDEVRSWFGDDEAERRRLHDEEERMWEHSRMIDDSRMNEHSRMVDHRPMPNDQPGATDNYRDSGRDSQRSRASRGWDSSRGYGSNMDRDYGRDVQQSLRHGREPAQSYFRSSNDYGGSRNQDLYRDYPTHNSGRSSQNKEDDEMKRGYENRSDLDQSVSDAPRLFGGRDYDREHPTGAGRDYPTRAERDQDTHQHDRSAGWQSDDSHRGYRSLNNTGRTGIGQDNYLGKERDSRPNYQDRNYSRGDYTPNQNAGGQEYDSRHYEQRGAVGSTINEHAQQGYSQGYGRTGYSLNPSTGRASGGNYANAETNTPRHPRNYRGADDRIYVDVCEALGRELDASSIEVKSSGGEITLTGSVRSRDDKRRAERIAERVQGVEDVHNRLTVKLEADDPSSTATSPIQAQTRTTEADKSIDAESAKGLGRSSSSNGSGRGTAKK